MLHRLWLLAALFAPAVAVADAYDFSIHQLGNPYETCAGGPCVGYSPAANANFRSFARRLGAGVTAANLMPPETLGHSAFAITAEISGVGFINAAGDGAMTQAEFPTTAQFRNPLWLPSIHIRKGLPFSFEIGARAAWLEKSRMGVGTLELKWALNEGFRYIPDIGVRAYVTKILNTRDFDVTTGGLDVGVGKQFALAGMVTLTPYLGWNLGFTGATSNNVDFDPTRTLQDSDSVQVPTPERNFYVFNEVRAAENSHNRFYFGFRFIGGYFTFLAEFSYTLLGNFDDPLVGRVNAGSVLALNGSIGFDF